MAFKPSAAKEEEEEQDVSEREERYLKENLLFRSVKLR